MSERESLAFKEEGPLNRFLGVAVIFDLEGFTEFCTRPQVEHRIPQFLNRTSELLCSCLDPTFAPDSPYEFSLAGLGRPEHVKFLGDGGLIIWALPESPPDQRDSILSLLNRLYVARRSFPDVVEACKEDFGLTAMPEKLRVGLAAGEILRLASLGGGQEFVGFPINLASRLQGYCRGLGFLASARVGIPSDFLEEHGFHKVNGRRLRGFAKELLIVDKEDFYALKAKERSFLFENV